MDLFMGVGEEGGRGGERSEWDEGLRKEWEGEKTRLGLTDARPERTLPPPRSTSSGARAKRSASEQTTAIG